MLGLKKIKIAGRWKPFPTLKKQILMSTVGSIGPKSFHNRCCWCIGCRWKKPFISSCWGNPLKLPKIIFVACLSFKFFYSKIYPNIPKDHKYILIIADEDTTIPKQIDRRWKSNISERNKHVIYRHGPAVTNEMWKNLVDNTNIIHIFASHLDIPKTNKYSPLPVGFNPQEHPKNNIDTLLLQKVDTNIMSRPLKIRGCCRIRGDPQWNDRKIVSRLARNCWSKFSDWGSIPRSSFFTIIQKYSFLFCPHGGGLEPNPKVFCAIYCCTIPIIKRFINCEILYEDLPVVFIDDWKKNNITLEKLKIWRENLKPYFSGDKREKVLEKMTSDYWMKYILRNSGLNSLN